ncbi:ribonuclease T2-like protein, partial [Coniochaeta sp. 2T2.1]
LSCSTLADPTKSDSCCVETFGGLVLATQTVANVNPKDTGTIHGLWRDFCNGPYAQYCDLSRQYDPLAAPNTTTGTPSGTPVTPLDWDIYREPGPDFWGHEFSKHATCFSSFDPECYGPLCRQHEEVVDFFQTVV